MQANALGLAVGSNVTGVNARSNASIGGTGVGVAGSATGNGAGTVYGGYFSGAPSITTTGTSYGVYGASQVFNNGGTSTAYGVMGNNGIINFSGGTTTGYGVYGTNSSGFGGSVTYGVYGEDAYGYYGVYGIQDQGSGSGYGGYFTNNSTGAGFGLYGDGNRRIEPHGLCRLLQQRLGQRLGGIFQRRGQCQRQSDGHKLHRLRRRRRQFAFVAHLRDGDQQHRQQQLGAGLEVGNAVDTDGAHAFHLVDDDGCTA